MKIAQLLLVSVLLCVFAAAEDEPPKTSTLTTNPVYRQNCAKCHGETAEGRHFRGPSLVSAKAAAVSADDLRNIITKGKGHMPKFGGKLTASDIDALVEQIKASDTK